ncbi:hypothetical protein NB716_000368 [Pantoea ananatis]|nr:hypothetical protein [Pantoea ananatis]
MKKIIIVNLISLFCMFLIKDPKTILEAYVYYAGLFILTASVILSPLIYVLFKKDS